MKRITAILIFILAYQFAFAQIDSLKFGLKGKIIRALAKSPNTPNTYFAGLKGNELGTGMVYKSEDRGKTWKVVNNGLAISPYTSDIQAIAIARDTEQTIYAGTWKDGMYKSKDGGKSWQKDVHFPSSDIRSIKTGIQNPLLVYAATSAFGVVKSMDGGKTWKRNAPETIDQTFKFAWSVEIDENNDAVVYAQTFSEGVWKSVNQGETWTRILEAPEKVCWDLKSQGSELWVAASKRGDDLSTLYHSKDTGTTWEEISDVPQNGLSQVNVIDVNGQRHIITGSWKGGVSIYKNQEWTKHEEVDFDSMSEILIQNQEVIIGSWGNGIYRLKL